MKVFALTLALVAMGSAQVPAAFFENLGFEPPTFLPVPSVYPGSVDPIAALPHWAAYWETGLAPYVLHDGEFLDSVGISVLDTNTVDGYQYLHQAFQGQYTLLLQGGFAHGGDPLARLSASVSQTGLAPLSAKSLTF